MNLNDKLEMMDEISKRNDKRSEEFEQETMLVVFVDVYGSGEAQRIRIRPELDEYYRLLQCNLFDIPTRSIGGRTFPIICDDEGLMRQDYRVSAFCKNPNNPMLVGNLLICQCHGGDELEGLTDEEADFIMSHVHHIFTNVDGHIETWQAISDMDY